MSWQLIDTNNIADWNEKLKQTNALFYQYPYFGLSLYHSAFSKPIFLQYKTGEEVQAFCTLIVVGANPFKVAIAEYGPVILDETINRKTLLHDLKKFTSQQGYMHLQIRTNDVELEHLLKQDSCFHTKLLFPFHQQEEYDSNIYNKPEDELLKGFKMQCRRKIVLAGRVDFVFKKLETPEHFLQLNNLFNKAAKEKGYKYMPFYIYRNLIKNGKPHGLCDVYGAFLQDELVNAVIVLKDRDSYYHFSSALVVKGYKYNESPPAKLHFFIMQDCFYNENKKVYNISFGGSNNLMRFKELFNPIEIERPLYYTYEINKKALTFTKILSPEITTFIRNTFKAASKTFSKTAKAAI